MDILKLEHVQKQFGDLQVIRDVGFTVAEHSVFGLIGKNGAGKTTTMKMILGFLQSSAGEIRVCGEKVAYGKAQTNRHIGYLPDVPEFYGFLTPKEYLKLCAQISGQKQDLSKRTDELLEMVGLAGVNRRIRGFSRGMKQRLGIAQAMLGRPKLLICDEPTSALDPIGRKEILELLSVAGKQTSILFSTHILSDVERVCDHIGILDKGKIVLNGDIEKIRASRSESSLRIELAEESTAVGFAETCKRLPFVTSSQAKENAVTLRLSQAEADGRRILELLLREDIPILKYEVLRPSLEDVFLEVVQ